MDFRLHRRATVGFGLLGTRIARNRPNILRLDLLRSAARPLRQPGDRRDLGKSPLIVLAHQLHRRPVHRRARGCSEVVLGVPYVWGATGLALTVCLYTAYGGFRAVAWDGQLPGNRHAGRSAAHGGFALRKAGGFAGACSTAWPRSRRNFSPGPGPDNFLPLPAAISFFFIWPLAVAGQPALITSSSGLPRYRRAQTGFFSHRLLYSAAVPGGYFRRHRGARAGSESGRSDHALPATILAAGPSAVGRIRAGRAAGAIMSTVSSFLLVSSSALVRDLYQRNINRKLQESATRRLTHLATFAVAAGCRDIRLAATRLSAIHRRLLGNRGWRRRSSCRSSSGSIGPAMNRTGCLAGIAAGFSSFCCNTHCSERAAFTVSDPFVWSLGICALACGLGSRLGAPSPRDLLQRYFGVDRRAGR